MTEKSRTETAAAAPGLPPLSEYVTAAVLSWLIPGAGHWLLGYRVRGAILAVLLLGLFWSGEIVLADRLAVTRECSPIFFVGQIPNGLSTLVANRVWGQPRPSTMFIDRDLPQHLNVGILCTLLSGLLNVLLILHVLDPQSWAEARRAREESAHAAAEEPLP